MKLIILFLQREANSLTHCGEICNLYMLLLLFLIAPIMQNVNQFNYLIAGLRHDQSFIEGENFTFANSSESESIEVWNFNINKSARAL